MIKTSFKWGLYLGLAISLGTQVLTWFGLGLTNWFVFLTFIFVIAFVALAIHRIKTHQSGRIKFSQAALAVLIIVFVSRYVFQLYMFFYINYIEPTWIETVSESWSTSLQESGATQEVIEQTIAAFQKAWEPQQVFTVEVVKYGISQFVLGMLVASYFVFGRPRESAEQRISSQK